MRTIWLSEDKNLFRLKQQNGSILLERGFAPLGGYAARRRRRLCGELDRLSH